MVNHLPCWKCDADKADSAWCCRSCGAMPGDLRWLLIYVEFPLVVGLIGCFLALETYSPGGAIDIGPISAILIGPFLLPIALLAVALRLLGGLRSEGSVLELLILLLYSVTVWLTIPSPLFHLLFGR